MKIAALTEAPKKELPLNSGEKRDIPILLKSVKELEQKLHQIERMVSDIAYNMPTTGFKALDAQAKSLSLNLQKVRDQLVKRIAAAKGTSTKPQAKVMPLFRKISKECSQYIDVLRKVRSHGSERYLYRGIKNTTALAFLGQSRQDRKVKDSRSDVSEFYDEMLIGLGFEAIRSNSIFATSSESSANSYGEAYYIFPRNGYHFSYTSHRDLIMDNSTIRDMSSRQLLAQFFDEYKAWRKTTEGEQTREMVRKIAATPSHERTKSEQRILRMEEDLHGYIENDRPEYFLSLIQRYQDDLENLKQIMPERFYGVRPYDFVTEKSFINFFGPRQDELEYAIKDGVEVCISGSYYALRVTEFRRMVDWLVDQKEAPTNSNVSGAELDAADKENWKDRVPNTPHNSYDPEQDIPF